ncbi:MAG TPA: ArsC/Spx/MgsR family protein, partial [Gammaproteobacteria bacterium]|nr:ArsC/Spx/MgsR family protein [Gammaproteobacteria bacterium]
IERALALLKLEPRELMRRDEAEYRSAGADDTALSHQALIEFMHRYPVLIQRPVVFAGDAARIGRPPEAVLEIL